MIQVGIIRIAMYVAFTTPLFAGREVTLDVNYTGAQSFLIFLVTQKHWAPLLIFGSQVSAVSKFFP